MLLLDEVMETVKKYREYMMRSAVIFLGFLFFTCTSVQSFAQDFENVEAQAQVGDTEAQVQLGDMYRRGKGVEYSLEEALYWYKKAADNGNARAFGRIGNAYLFGEGVEKDPVKYISFLRKSAEMGWHKAQFRLSDEYQRGEILERNLAEEVKWLEKSAAQGNSAAQRALAYKFKTGSGVAQDDKKAARLYFLSWKGGFNSSKDDLVDLLITSPSLLDDLLKDW